MKSDNFLIRDDGGEHKQPGPEIQLFRRRAAPDGFITLGEAALIAIAGLKKQGR
jgi:hypothetical protein